MEEMFGGTMYGLWMSVALATTWTIGPTGDSPTLADALDNAVDGDTLAFEQGTHVVDADLTGRELMITSEAWLATPTVTPTAWPVLVPAAVDATMLTVTSSQVALAGLRWETAEGRTIEAANAALTLTDVQFRGLGDDALDGAALYAVDSSVQLTRIDVANLIARDGALYIAGGSLDAVDLSCSTVEVWGDGACLHLRDTTATWAGGLATQTGGVGTGPLHGGAVFALNSTLSLSNLVFDTTFAVHGGGLSARQSNTSLNDVVFVDAFALNDGAGAYIESGEHTWVNVTMSGGQATRGGAVAIRAGAEWTDIGGFYSDNTANTHGGIIHSFHSHPVLTDSAMEFGIAGGAGGCLAAEGGTLTMTGATLAGCTALGDGGSLHALNVTSGLDDVVMTGSTAGRLSTATTQASGGAAWFSGGATTVFDMATCATTATSTGGSVYVNGPMSLTQAALLESHAEAEGGALRVGPAGVLDAEQLTVLGSHAPVGAHMVVDGAVSLTNTLLADGQGNPAVVPSMATALLHVALSHDGEWFGGGWTPSTADVVLPFACSVRDWSPNAVLDDDLRLVGGSPCIDAGTPTLLDQDGSISDVGWWGGPLRELADDDGDGVAEHLDCDDADATIGQATFEGIDHAYDGIDQDCDGEDLIDVDRDGYASSTVGGLDCADEDASVSPDATEVWYDGIDQDCDGLSDYDADGDGHDAEAFGGDDCDDANASISPQAIDLPYDGLDGDCDGLLTWEYDADRDGIVAVGHGGTDCDDLNPTVFPGAPEWPYDGIDQDCDGIDLIDVDNDGFPGSLTPGGVDCDDTRADVSPVAQEIWYDGIDQDCDGNDSDRDLDGEPAREAGGLDCDDDDAAIGPHAEEVWYDGIDQNCDGANDDDQDGDGYAVDEDCDDTRAIVYPGAPELQNGVDDNCDGFTELDDRDADGVDDWTESLYGTDPLAADSDGDGRGDHDELQPVDAAPDTDGDGRIDALDEDDDDDGIASIDEGAIDINGDGQSDDDIDNDGIPNAYDLDSDGDGFLDSTEGLADLDRDGIPDFADYQGQLTGGGLGCNTAPVSLPMGGLALLLLAVRRRSTALVLLATPTVAAAQDSGGIDIHNHHILNTSDGLRGHQRLVTPSRDTAYGAALAFDYAWRPLVEQLPDGPSTLVGGLTTAQLLVDVRPLAGLRLAAAVPVGIGHTPTGSFTGLGDPRLDVAYTPLMAKGYRPGVSVAAHIWAPSGNQALSYGTSRASVAATLALEERIGRVGLTANLGARIAPGPPTFARNVETRWGPMVGVGVNLEANDWVSATVDVVSHGLTGWTNLPVEASVGSRLLLPKGLWAHIGVGMGLTQGLGAPGFRSSAVLGWAWRPKASPEVGRSIAPAPMPVVLDEDDTPSVSAEPEEDPGLESDATSNTEDIDAVTENDADLVEDTPIPQATAAPPDLSIAEEPVWFAVNSTSLSTTQRTRLDAIATLLQTYPELDLVLVGHADMSGRPSHNEDLALSRAVAVRRALIARGVGPQRITTSGEGARQPYSGPHGDSPWASDRRVHIQILPSMESQR